LKVNYILNYINNIERKNALEVQLSLQIESLINELRYEITLFHLL